MHSPIVILVVVIAVFAGCLDSSQPTEHEPASMESPPAAANAQPADSASDADSTPKQSPDEEPLVPTSLQGLRATYDFDGISTSVQVAEGYGLILDRQGVLRQAVQVGIDGNHMGWSGLEPSSQAPRTYWISPDGDQVMAYQVNGPENPGNPGEGFYRLISTFNQSQEFIPTYDSALLALVQLSAATAMGTQVNQGWQALDDGRLELERAQGCFRAIVEPAPEWPSSLEMRPGPDCRGASQNLTLVDTGTTTVIAAREANESLPLLTTDTPWATGGAGPITIHYPRALSRWEGLDGAITEFALSLLQSEGDAFLLTDAWWLTDVGRLGAGAPQTVAGEWQGFWHLRAMPLTLDTGFVDEWSQQFLVDSDGRAIPVSMDLAHATRIVGPDGVQVGDAPMRSPAEALDYLSPNEMPPSFSWSVSFLGWEYESRRWDIATGCNSEEPATAVIYDAKHGELRHYFLDRPYKDSATGWKCSFGNFGWENS